MGRGVSRIGRSVHNTPTITPWKRLRGMPAVISAWKHGVSKMGLVGSAVSLGKANQTNGFDCPGCAWPDPKHRSPSSIARTVRRLLLTRPRSKLYQTHFGRELHTCLGRRSDRWLNSQGRLSRPMILEKGSNHYVPLDWDRAIGIIAKTWML